MTGTGDALSSVHGQVRRGKNVLASPYRATRAPGVPMIPEALFWVSLFLFLVAFAALLFDFRGFREFVTHPSPQGAASLGGWFSFRGSVVLLMTLAIVVGVFSPLLRPNSGSAGVAENEMIELRSENAALRGEVSTLAARITELGTPDGILRALSALVRDDDLTSQLAAMAARREGPWSLPESEELLASVPGQVEEGFAAGCGAHHGRSLQLVGDGMRSTVTVQVATLMYQAANCRDIAGFDLMLSCPEANQMFGDSVLTCDGLTPLWTDGAPSLLAVHAVEV